MRKSPLFALIDKNAEDRQILGDVLRTLGLVVPFDSVDAAGLLLHDVLVPDVLIIDLSPPCEAALRFIGRVLKSRYHGATTIVALTPLTPEDERVSGSDFHCLQKPTGNSEVLSRALKNILAYRVPADPLV